MKFFYFFHESVVALAFADFEPSKVIAIPLPNCMTTLLGIEGKLYGKDEK
nr:hypothetical protein [Lentibacillus amyloliquefaciens]